MKKKVLLLLVGVLLLPLAGSNRPGRYVNRHVTQAQIQFFQPGRQQFLQYTSPEKISSVLNCLRLAAPYGRVTAAPANPNAHHYRITLEFSDRSRQVYHLQDYRYLSRDGTNWQKVPVKQAHYLYLLLHLLPPDN